MSVFSPAFRPLALSLAAAGALAGSSMPAFAQAPADSMIDAPSGMTMTVTRVPVKISDLNLMSVEGRAAADRRVRAAARQACAIGLGKVTLEQAQDQRNCFSAALRQGKVQVALAREQVLASR
ncbi:MULTISPECIES: UrcA family protein [unclassified Novosphingobium]|uniref:UrcA family protein n=1 Tax=Novosphingobium TaxID=165696 RepID=UPI001445FBA6|nr:MULTISPECIES: UrcA family protein [unclassified Novosphingobium]NKJ43015.1 UrcA family protein [Novosphingobium sp. SG720]NMN07245.1 UrcA family protein [Novosphingobium sp. SG919]NMN89166.1 UrcA family protein [Novosphingobium sp. SG916]